MNENILDMDSLLTSMDQVMPVIDKIIKSSFPELKSIKIILGTVNSDSVFLESRPILYSLVWPFKVKYKITVNPKLFEFELPLFALEGILAHELAHTAHYVTEGRFGTIMTALVFFKHSKHVEFERRTDIDAITRGYGKGIKAYREIVFRDLTQEQKVIKNERYFTAQEIDALMLVYNNSPQLREKWLDSPPLSLADIRKDANSNIA